jgi:hypothetical protein
MPSDSNSGTSYKNWALGIIGAVLTTVLVFVIEQKLTNKPPDKPTPTPVEIVSVNGRVFDSAAKRLLENVAVHVHVSTYDQEQNTDSEGRYAFSLEVFDPRLSGSMEVVAAGYKTLTYNLPLQQMSQMQDVYLELTGSLPPTGGSSGGNPVVISHAPIETHYLARLDPKRISALAAHH